MVWRGIALVFIILLVVAVLRELRAVIVQLLLAILIASATTPVVDALTTSERARRWRWRPTRAMAALVVFVGAMIVVVLGAITIVATVTPDVSTLTVTLPAMSDASGSRSISCSPATRARRRVNAALPSVQDLAGGAMGLLGQASRVLAVATGSSAGCCI